MRLEVQLFASLRERAGTQRLVLDGLPEPLDIDGLRRELRARHPELGELEGVRAVLADAYVDGSAELADGAVVALLPPVSGGSGDAAQAEPESARLERGVFEVHTDALDPEAARRRVSHDSCGASVVFTGTTRERNQGKDVVELDYEAFQSMAGAEMQRIFSECGARFGPDAVGDEAPAERLLRMLTLHRVGKVGVGEPSVVVAVASPHRAPAFDAARFLIDELKTRVPLWKREVYGDGHHWIGDRS